jgi:hypothetical protein
MEINMTVQTYEEGGRAGACREFLLHEARETGLERVLILPIPTTRDKVHLKDSGILLSDIEKQADEQTLVIGYDLPLDFASRLFERGARVYDASLDELFLEKNAELTALATLGILLTGGGCALSDMKIGIVGFGRIGRSLARMLMFHGAEVRIFTSRSSTRLELGGAGVAVSASCKDADLSRVDILINTAPAVIFEYGVPPGIRVIDLASGDNFPGTRVEKYPSIPAKMFPISAGRELGQSAMRFLNRGENFA